MQNHFCHICCINTYSKFHSNKLHECNKSCYFNTMALKTERLDLEVCLSPPTPNIYDYCEIKFHQEKKQKICKYDYCQMCCISLSKVINSPISLAENVNCFKKCSLSKLFNKTSYSLKATKSILKSAISRR